MKSFGELGILIDKEIDKISYPKKPELLYRPINYIMGLHAKRIRPILLLLAHQIFNENLTKAIDSAIAIEVFHNFTLLHDDIMDNASLRRGNLTVHEKWNPNVAILSGDTMLIKAYQLFSTNDTSILKDVLDVFSSAAIEVCEGQQSDMDFENRNDVSIMEYLKMIEKKTAVLLAASLKIGAIIGGANKVQQKSLYNFGKNIGIAFQLRDDLLDVFGNSKSFGKRLGGDILSNKKTFLFLKALDLSDEIVRQKLISYYNMDSYKEKVEDVKSIFNKLNVQKHTLDMMQNYYNKALKNLDSIVSVNKSPLIDFANNLMHRIS